MPKKILVGILDWGLGHATRCIPLISYLLQTQCQIIIAASGQQKKILQEVFPEAIFLEPPVYGIRYPPGGKKLVWALIRQLPLLRKTIREEHLWVRKIVSEHRIDLIISDNRYGFHCAGIPAALITHQLSPRSGWGQPADLLARKIHYHYLRPFTECWVPDFAPNGGLAGELSHPTALPPHAFYIGPLSRLTFGESTFGESTFGESTFGESTFGESTFGESTFGECGVLALVSGPEPARTEFEELLRPQLKGLGRPYLLVRGLPGSENRPGEHELNHVEAGLLARLLAGANLVICRSGYTSVMDLVKLRKKAVLVPTPGQTEQAYLAEHLQEKKIFPFLLQSEFQLKKAISIAEDFEYSFPETDFEAFKKTVDRFINK